MPTLLFSNIRDKLQYNAIFLFTPRWRLTIIARHFQAPAGETHTDLHGTLAAKGFINTKSCCVEGLRGNFQPDLLYAPQPRWATIGRQKVCAYRRTVTDHRT